MASISRAHHDDGYPDYDLAPPPAGVTLRRAVYTLAVLGILIALLLILASWLRSHPYEAIDTDGLTAVLDWAWPGSSEFFDLIALVTAAWFQGAVAAVAIVLLFATGHRRQAVGLGIAGGIVGAAAVLADYTLGAWVGRLRPNPGAETASFPSGHALGATAFLGFAAYLAIRHRLRMTLRVPLLAVLAIGIGTAGLSRVHQEAHWPTDVAGGYILGVITLVVVIHLHRWMESVRWFSPPALGRDIPVVPVRGVRLGSSYASVVMLDREAGTATKIFHPPFIIRLIYWLAFQAKFPYDANPFAVEAAKNRREVAGYLTKYRFGKNLVAPIVALGCIGGRPSIVSKLIAGEEAPNDEEARSFLHDVTVLFAAAGLPVWQLNPRNPHAHTNIIRTPDGDQIIVDLESAVATPLPAGGSLRSALRRGSYPVFDDIDFERLRAFVHVHEADLKSTLGPGDYDRFLEAIACAESCTIAWKGAELRLPSRVVRFVFALLNWKAFFLKSKHAISESDVKAEAFLAKGLDQWVAEGRIEPEEAERLRAELRTREVHDAMKHLGAHLAITALFRFPFGSIIRPVWTLAFFGLGLFRAIRSGGRKCRDFLALHSPIVVLLSIIPGFGGFAYLTARPLRRRILIRLLIDRIGRKVPLRLYSRSHIDRLIAPAPRPSAVPPAHEPAVSGPGPAGAR